MEAIILTKEQFDHLTTVVEDIHKKIDKHNQPLAERFVDNDGFLALMKISRRTAQLWRDEGKITFSQIGNKIYYKLSDIDALITKHSIKAFKK